MSTRPKRLCNTKAPTGACPKALEAPSTLKDSKKTTIEVLRKENSKQKAEIKLLQQSMEVMRLEYEASTEKLTVVNGKLTVLQAERDRLSHNLRMRKVLPKSVKKATATCTEAASRPASRQATKHDAAANDDSADEEDEEEKKEEDEEVEEAKKEEFKTSDAFNALPGAFPITKEVLDNISIEDDRRFVLKLVGSLYSPQYLRLHKKSDAKGTHGENIKIPIPREQYIEIQKAICSALKVQLDKRVNRLPPHLERAISQKFNQVRPTDTDKEKLRNYWKTHEDAKKRKL